MATAKKASTEVANVMSAEVTSALADLFPVEQSTQKIMLPRLGMFSQDKYEKDPKTKEITLVKEAGVFYTEIRGDDIVNEDGSTSFNFVKTEIGSEIEGIILYTRKQLSHYDGDTETYTSSPIYDTDDEVIPLWCNKAEIERGTPAELKAKYPPAPGKKLSSLKENKIVYVLYLGEVFQLNLSGSSMYSFKDYAKKIRPNTVVTRFSSEPQSKGDVSWNQMTFVPVRSLTAEEGEDIRTKTLDIIETVRAEKAQFATASVNDAVAAVNAKWTEMTAGK